MKLLIGFRPTCLSTDLTTFGNVLLLPRIESELDVFSLHLCTSTKYGNEDSEKGVLLAVGIENAQLLLLIIDIEMMFLAELDICQNIIDITTETMFYKYVKLSLDEYADSVASAAVDGLF